MRHIKQRHISGCGVAAIAMLTGVSYNKAMKAVRPDRKVGDGAAVSLKDMVSGLETLGYGVKLSYQNNKLRRVKQNAIIAVWNPIDSDTLLHMVVWDAEKEIVLDPWNDRFGTAIIYDKLYVEKHNFYRLFLVED